VIQVNKLKEKGDLEIKNEQASIDIYDISEDKIIVGQI